MLKKDRVALAHEMIMKMMDTEHLVSKEAINNRFDKQTIKWLLNDEYLVPRSKEMYEVFVYPTPKELGYEACKDLGYRIAIQAAKDYFERPWEQEGIINILKSEHMDFLTGGYNEGSEGLSIALAKTLKVNSEQVKNVVMREEI